MQGIASAPSPSRPKGEPLTRRIWHLALALELALAVRRERRMLLGLDDRTLRDIGFGRSEAYTEAQRSFWDIPIDRLRL